MNEIGKLKAKLNESEGTDKIELLCQIGNQYYQKLEYDKSLGYMQEALQLAQNASEEKYIVICFHKIGLVFWRKNDFSTAMHYFQKALPLYKKLNNNQQAARLGMAIGVTFYNMGENQKAKVQLRQAICRIIRINDKELLAKTYNWLGIVYNELSEYENAMKYYMKGLKLEEEIGNKFGIAVAKNSIGLIHLYSHHYEQAEKYFSESLQIRREINDKIGIADSLHNIGMLFFDQRDFDSSLQNYKKSLEIRQQIGGKAKMANTYNNIGNIYVELGNIEKALEQHKLALEIRKEIGNEINILRSKQNICGFLLENDQLEEGKKYLNDCVEALGNQNSTFLDSDTYRLKMIYYEKIGDFQQAYQNQTKYHRLKAELNEKENTERILEIQAKYEMEKQIQENRFLQLKNVKLQKANETIGLQNMELLARNDHIQLTNKILRHDIINNLSVMKSAMHLYEKTKESSYLEEIPKQIEKSIKLLKKLRNLSKFLRDDNKFYPVDLRKNIFEKLIPNYSTLNIEINGKGTVLADQMLESVFDNLCSNAVKHSKTEKVIIDILDRNKFIQINFSDFGIGIPDEIQDKIFEESYIYGKSGHTGLGLYIVKKAINNYGGLVKVEKNRPQGTVFVIKLKKAK